MDKEITRDELIEACLKEKPDMEKMLFEMGPNLDNSVPSPEWEGFIDAVMLVFKRIDEKASYENIEAAASLLHACLEDMAMAYVSRINFEENIE